VTIFAVIAFAMLLVMIGLVVDVGRVMNVHSQTSAYVDRAALAAAAELDGRPCAIVRAVAAVTGLDTPACGAEQQVPTGQRLTLSGDRSVNVERMVFLSSIDPEAVTATWRRGEPAPNSGASADRLTRYVTVQTTPESERFLFFSMLSGTTQDATVATRATAGFERRVCNTIPLMVCNPDEQAGGGGSFNAQVGREFRASLRNGNDVWDRDHYSLLDVNDRRPAALRNYMERNNPNTMCYAQRVGVEQGLDENQRDAIRRGLNDRYDDGGLRRNFPVAIVNCRQNRSENPNNIPVEAWIEVRMTVEVEEENHQGHDHNYLNLRVRGTIPANLNAVREFPVLTR
jgi:hypothetical protein